MASLILLVGISWMPLQLRGNTVASVFRLPLDSFSKSAATVPQGACDHAGFSCADPAALILTSQTPLTPTALPSGLLGAINRRSTNFKGLRNFGRTQVRFFHLPHFARINRRWTPFIHTGSLCPGDAFGLSLFPQGLLGGFEGCPPRLHCLNDILQVA
jgi:hypothetical protein